MHDLSLGMKRSLLGGSGAEKEASGVQQGRCCWIAVGSWLGDVEPGKGCREAVIWAREAS